MQSDANLMISLKLRNLGVSTLGSVKTVRLISQKIR